MSVILSDVVIWILIPAGLLPILTAFVLRRYRNDPSQSLRDRWHVALALAALGVATMLLAANRVLSWGFAGEWVVIAFALMLLVVDVVSAKWLIAYYTGAFEELPRHPETAIEREDREVGDTRRAKQAEALEKEESA